MKPSTRRLPSVLARFPPSVVLPPCCTSKREASQTTMMIDALGERLARSLEPPFAAGRCVPDHVAPCCPTSIGLAAPCAPVKPWLGSWLGAPEQKRWQ